MTDPFNKRFPPGHFYSPVPDMNEIETQRDKLFGPPPKSIPGVNLRRAAQIRLLKQFRDHFVPQIPYMPDTELVGQRFEPENGFFSGKDAATLICLLLKLRPRHVIEIGSGFSSAVCLDINNLFFENAMKMTFIDPNPERLLKLMTPEDRNTHTVLPIPVQDIDPKMIDMLEKDDILFIDSSHVCKIGSDVNFELFEILPRLKKGVYIHIHDIFYPFEYPENWMKQGRAWNEAYILRAFLQYNSAFQIEFFISYLWQECRKDFGDHWMFAAELGGRGSLWLKKTA